jgi:WD40 repeat protein
MKLTFGEAVKGCPARVTCSAWHPSASHLMLTVGDKFGHLGFLDITSSLNRDTHVVHTLHPHETNISGVQYVDNVKLMTCSYDGNVKLLDVNTQQFTEVDIFDVMMMIGT